MYISKKIKEKNIEINFVDITLRGFETNIYFNKKNRYIHRKIIYSNLKIKNPKVNSTKKIKINDDKCRYIIIVEENGLKAKKYTVYIRNDSVIERIDIPTNHVITSDVLQYINEKILEENIIKEKYQKDYEKYNSLPNGVKNCIPFEDIEFLEKAISENTWYRNQMERLTILPFVLKTKNVKNWLSKIGIYSVSKKQKDLDSIAIYVAFRLTKCLPLPEKDVVIKSLLKNITKGDEMFYSEYVG